MNVAQRHYFAVYVLAIYVLNQVQHLRTPNGLTVAVHNVVGNITLMALSQDTYIYIHIIIKILICLLYQKK